MYPIPRLVLPVLLLLAGCHMEPIGLKLAAGWQVRSLAVWSQARPDMLALSPSGKWLYVSCETDRGMSSLSLVAIRLKTGHQQVLIAGLKRADGLKFAPDSSLWIGEEFSRGLIWRVADVDRLPTDQRVDRGRLSSSHVAIAPFYSAGRFAHEGIAFSRDQRFAYLADEAVGGALYRLQLHNRRLALLDTQGQWRTVPDPMHAKEAATPLHAMRFNRIEDMEVLPDGRILMAETGTGRILALDDLSGRAVIQTYLHDTRLPHPDNLAWDARRGWLWITDDSRPSVLWAWNNRRLIRIASHAHAEITGVLPVDADVYLNLQGRSDGPELTVHLFQATSKGWPVSQHR